MYVGNTPADKYISMAVQHFTTSATTSYTLDHAVTNENEIRLVINNVVQQPGSSYAYTASGTALTLSAATTSSDTMYCVFLGKAVQTVTPAASSVTNSMLAGSIANSKLANSSITLNGSAVSLGGSATISSNPVFIKRTLNTSAVSNVDVTSCFSATYDVYIIYGYIDVITDANQIYFNFLKNTSDNFSGSNMNGNNVGYVGTTSPSSFTNHGQASATYGRIAGGNVYHAGNGSGCLFEMMIANPFDRSDGNIHVGFTAMYEGSSGVTQAHGAFVYSGTEVASGIRFGSFGSAQLGKCSIDVYGVPQS